MNSRNSAIAASIFAVGVALSLAPAASATPSDDGTSAAAAACRSLRPGVWGCRAVNPVPVYRDHARLGDAPLRWIQGGWFETNCKNDSGNYSGPGPHSHRWEYTTYGGAGGWVPDSKVHDETNPVQNCPR
ncbi:hypothetical protein [Actinosynnema sp. NPDC020468]|uniref:hypothetical protein n=1 Tax=Actinosynnema sp. NPDC020468 TaxID=3154488 RepID=UPI0033C0E3FF